MCKSLMAFMPKLKQTSLFSLPLYPEALDTLAEKLLRMSRWVEAYKVNSVAETEEQLYLVNKGRSTGIDCAKQ